MAFRISPFISLNALGMLTLAQGRWGGMTRMVLATRAKRLTPVFYVCREAEELGSVATAALHWVAVLASVEVRHFLEQRLI
jgi:hypothetical protein